MPQETKIKNPHDQIVYNIGYLYTLLEGYFAFAYKEFGLSPAQFNLLMAVKHVGKDEGISQCQIGKHLYVTAANITRMIDGLEAHGLLARSAHLNDRRINLIKITSKGAVLLDRVWIKHVAAVNALMKKNSAKETEVFNQQLGDFIAEMEEKVAQNKLLEVDPDVIARHIVDRG